MGSFLEVVWEKLRTKMNHWKIVFYSHCVYDTEFFKNQLMVWSENQVSALLGGQQWYKKNNMMTIIKYCGEWSPQMAAMG